jgi:hypothetical protein
MKMDRPKLVVAKYSSMRGLLRVSLTPLASSAWAIAIHGKASPPSTGAAAGGSPGYSAISVNRPSRSCVVATTRPLSWMMSFVKAPTSLTDTLVKMA